MFKSVIFAFACLGLAAAIPVDNGVEGDPEIECGPTSITVNFNTRNSFEGHVYVKGLYDQEEAGCRNTDRGRQVAGIELDFATCNTRRSRSLNPKGVFVSTTVIVSFHPLFITKVDRAYKIQCFYMEADKTVDTRLEVSMLTTDFKTQQVPMPVCRYEILTDVTGDPLEFAIVGQKAYHKWTCDTETQDTFCMNVYSCFVDDTNGDRVDLIGEDGCAVDRYLINNPEYMGDLVAGVEAHVFKYADRADLYFNCQIAIHVKEPNALCPRPLCAEPAGRGAGNANPAAGPVPRLGPGEYAFPVQGPPYSLRKKRSVAENSVGVMDVIAELDALDMTPSGQPSLPADFHHRIPSKQVFINQPATGFCISHSTFGLLLTVGAICLILIIAMSTFMLLRGGNTKN